MAWCRQAATITWVYVDQNPCRHMASFDPNSHKKADFGVNMTPDLPYLLIHWGLVTPYGDSDLGYHGLR